MASNFDIDDDDIDSIRSSQLSSGSETNNFTFLDKLDYKECLHTYFKNNKIRKTTQKSGWQTTKCRRCADNFNLQKMITTIRHC
jgi:hypothetical protein